MAAPRKPKKLNGDELWDYALRILATRAHSANELRYKLERRAESRSDVPQTIAKLREYSLTDDAKFSESLAASRLQNQQFGQLRILRELRGKRVADTVAQNAVSKVFAGVDENSLANSFLQRKYRGKNLGELLKEEKHLASAFRKLRMAGFSSSVSMSVLKRYRSEVDDWNDRGESE